MSLKVKKVPEFREAIYWFEELNCLTTEQRIVVNSFIQLFDYEKVISKQDIKELYDVVSVVYHHSHIDFKQSMLGVFIRSSLLNILEDSLDLELTGIAKRTRRKSSEKDEINEWVESMQNDFETISNNKDDK